MTHRRPRPRPIRVGPSRSRRLVVLVLALVLGFGGGLAAVVPAEAGLPESHTFDGWRSGQLGEPDFTIVADSETRRDGPIALRMDYASPTQGTGRYAHVFTDVLVRPGSTYTFSAWVRGQDVSAAGAFYFPLTGDHLQRQEVPAGTFDWQQLTWEYTIPANQSSFRMRILGRGAGTVWFDQLSMTLEGSSQNLLPNPSFDLFSPPAGALRFADETLIYHRGQAEVALETTASSLRWSLHSDTGQRVDGDTVAVVDGAAALDLSEQPNGYYTLDVEVDDPQPATRSASLAIIEPRSERSGPDHPFGLSIHARRHTVSSVQAMLDPLGLGMVRENPAWADIEKSPGVYDFSGLYDEQIRAAIARGERPLVITPISHPRYDDNQTPASPEAIAAYARMVGALAEHYGDAVDYEVYNEFNHTGNRGTCGRTPECYLQLLAPTAAAIRRAAPNARVVGGGIAGLDVTWLNRLFELGGLDHIDVVSFHAYDIPLAPEGETEAEVAGLRTALAAHGRPDLPIWMTEHGWHTQVGGVSEQLQSAYTVRSAQLIHAAGVERVLYYTMTDSGLDPAEKEHNFGLVRSNLGVTASLAPKPAYLGFGVLNRVTAGRRLAGVERVGAAYVARWSSPTLGEARVIWAPGGETIGVDLDAPVTVVEPMGREWPAGGNGQDLQLSVAEQPVYVVGDVGSMAVVDRPGVTLAPPDRIAAGAAVAIPLTVDGSSSGLQGPVELRGPVGAPAVVDAGDVPIEASLDWAPVEQTGRLPWRVTATTDDGLAALILDEIEVVQNPTLALVPTFDPTSGEPVATVRATSLAGAPRADIGTLTWSLGGRSGETPGGPIAGWEERSYELDRGAGWWQPLDYRVTTTVDGDERTLTGRTAFAPVVPVGESPRTRADWLEDADWVSLGGGPPDPDDLGGAFHLAADADGLQVIAEVSDDDHAAGPSPDQLWAGDSLQFAVSPGLPGSSTSRVELGAALLPGGPVLHRFTPPAGAVSTGSSIIERDESSGTTSYRITVGWDELGLDPTAGRFAFSAVLNDNDAGQREGYREWGSGIGGRKDTSLFLPVTRTTAPEMFVAAAATVRCRGRSSALEVAITNTGTVTTDVRATSDLGSKGHRALAPGRTVTLGMAGATTNGTVVVVASTPATAVEPAVHQQRALSYAGRTCVR